MSTTGLGEPPPRKLRRRARRLWEARTAQEAAAQAFARMDGLQRELRARFATNPPDGFASLDAETEAQAKEYLQIQDRNPVASEVGKPELLSASVAYRQAAFDCVRQAEQLEEFARRHPAS